MPPKAIELLERARAGDREALGELLSVFRNYLTLLAKLQIGRRLQGKADASDLVQETYVDAHRDFPQFRGGTEGELVSWLREIMARNLADLVRRFQGAQRRDVRLERRLAQELDQTSRLLDRGLVAREKSPSQEVAHREQSVLLADAIEGLPPDYNQVIVLRHFDGQTFPEIARQMGRSLDSVEKLWVRALVRLRKALGEVE